MAKKSVELREISRVNAALALVENAQGFEMITGFKISKMKKSCENSLDPFFKERDKAFSSKKKDIDVEKLREGVDFVYVTIKGAYSLPVLTSDYEEVENKLAALLDKKEDFEFETFNLSEFEREVSEKDETGKKMIKKKVSMVTPAFLKGMADFITDVKKEKTVKG